MKRLKFRPGKSKGGRKRQSDFLNISTTRDLSKVIFLLIDNKEGMKMSDLIETISSPKYERRIVDAVNWLLNHNIIVRETVSVSNHSFIYKINPEYVIFTGKMFEKLKTRKRYDK